jgi:hypothetical protein
MKTILTLAGLASIADSEAEILDLIDMESEECVSSGDLLGAGEWYISKLKYCKVAEEADLLLAKTIVLWASTVDLTFSPSSLKHLAGNIAYFQSDVLTAALIGVTSRRSRGVARWTHLLTDLAFRLSTDLKKVLQLKDDRPADLLSHVAAKMKTLTERCGQALALFQSSRCISARTAAIEVIRATRQVKPYLLPRERPIVAQIEMLLGGAFREFCQAYERAENERVMSI